MSGLRLRRSRGARWAGPGVWCALALLGLVLAALARTAGAAPEEVTREPTAVLELRSGSVHSVDGEAGQRSGPLELPYHWDRLHKGRPGSAVFSLPFQLEAAPQRPWGIYIARVGSVFELRLNGALLQASGDLGEAGGDDYAKAPIYVGVPEFLLRSGDNLLEIRIRADSGRRAGLSPVVIGPAAQVRNDYFAPAYAWRFTGSVLLAGFSAIVGSIALALWLTQVDSGASGAARRDAMYLWAAVAEFCWAIRVADGAITHPPLQWVGWGLAMTACYAGWAVAAMLFCHHVAGWQRNASMVWMRRLTLGILLASLLATALALVYSEPLWLTGWLAVEIVIFGVYVGVFLVATLVRPDTARVLVALVALATFAVGVRDWLVIRLGDAYGETTWVRYTSVFFGVALLAIMLERFHAASERSRHWTATLAQRVAARERELATTYARLEAVAREQARTHERERILRDMHDGVGSHISTAVRLLRAGTSSRDELLRILIDSLDQLKLSIDSIHLPPGDVGALLAALRYRMGSRFAASGIAMEWAVDEIAPLPQIDGAGMRQLQFLLFEAISNVLQHAHAGKLRIEAADSAQALVLRIVDDGVGFDARQLPRALRARAQALGAQLSASSRPGGTEICLRLERTAPAPAPEPHERGG